jgi:hypothetical protein
MSPAGNPRPAGRGGGQILDGYHAAQAEAAHRWAKARGVLFDLALFFEIGTDELLARLAGRAREEGRSDDTEDTVRHRLEVFRSRTYPLLAYYRRRGILVRIDAVGPVDAITERILAALHWHKANALAAGADRPEWAFGTAEGQPWESPARRCVPGFPAIPPARRWAPGGPPPRRPAWRGAGCASATAARRPRRRPPR